MGSNNEFDLNTISRRQAVIILGSMLVIAAVVVGVIVLVSSGPGPQAVAEATDTPAPPSPTASLEPTASPEGPPTETPEPSPTPTLEPYKYTVQPGETLLYIIQLFGYRDTSIIPEIVALNGMSSDTDLFADQVLLIPRQTSTPAPTATEGPTPTATGTPAPGTPTVDPNATPDYTGCSPTNRCVSADGQYWYHEVVEGETLAGLAFGYYTTLRDLLIDNNMNEESVLRPGTILRIRIRVTLTPTLTPTGGPDSTATPTPVFQPPALLAPAEGGSIAQGEQVVLQWAASRPLPEGAYYLVQVRNVESGEVFRDTTRSNIYRLPDSLRPGVGGSATYEWVVVVVEDSDPDSLVISEQGEGRTFT